jgi:hypothetical protein
MNRPDGRNSSNGPHEADRVERRTLLKGLAVGLAGSLAASESTAATTEVISAQPSPAASPTQSQSNLPRLLDDHQRRTLASLAELLVPGSVAAGVVDLMDRVAAADTAVGQRRLLNAIARFDQEAQTTYGRPWNDLDAMSRLAILKRASEAAGETKDPEPGATTGTTEPTQFVYLRNTVATTYLSTEAGMRERGWTGRTAWTELPGCPHPASAHE